MRSVLLCGLLLLIAVTRSVAQANEKNRFPKAILVEVFSEEARQQHLAAVNDADRLKQVKKDALAISKCIRRDFTDHFSAYPTYFFSDTDLHLVKEGKLKGILYNADGTQALTNVLGNNSTEFFIVYYGYPVAKKPRTKHIPGSANDAGSFDAHYRRGLVVNNYKMEQLTYVYPPNELLGGLSRKADKRYNYRSPVFDIEYRGTAHKLSDLLFGLPLNYE